MVDIATLAGAYWLSLDSRYERGRRQWLIVNLLRRSARGKDNVTRRVTAKNNGDDDLLAARHLDAEDFSPP